MQLLQILFLSKQKIQKPNKIEILSKLLKNKIIVRDLENYGLNNYFRVSIGTNSQMNLFMKILKNVIKKIK